jgi:endonuclease YncB( thermonuclease family)
MSPTYRYRALVARIIDGDTFICTIDLGFHVSTSKRVRLRGVNATESRAPGGPEATAFLTDLIDGKPLIVESYKDRMSFERWICDVWVAGEQPVGVAAALIAAGHGVAVAA